ncbi:FAD-dependent oxidoreductase [Aureimonas jatrophae]|uniref:Reductase C-terminal n=1 Tax=Aureimonas jatrophae TaxID=1166073 RepID=A0A1H0J8B6_9HYPH|nr:FAD-dependent oxidoreductase [Aureimonas jatrophae]MBB3951540.1 NADPH-dependent 2,4-dienoyl-CoA reductase/sulfur reductase-like enzyme/nitrite reductase/ring-hydroxylating ferredoxin subunit [Aureimonas jatrophae]SDO39977.1 Reductase C-terminal [Aureimonas jatrophae]
MRHDLCALSDLPPNGLNEVAVGDLKILVARDGDRVFATGATCTHKGAPLKNGQRVGNRVICPWHHAIFDLETGDHREPPGQGCLARFTVSVESGRVRVEVPEGAKPHRPSVTPADRRSGSQRIFAIVGAGAAGLACAKELVRGGFDGRIVLFAPEGEPPYDRTDLSKTYLQGKKQDDALPLMDADEIEALGIELRPVRVERIDSTASQLVLDGGERVTFDGCLAAPGSDASSLDLDGADAPNVLTLRSHGDAKTLLAHVQSAQRIVIVGSGFIGMEAAASLVSLGKAVCVLSRSELPFAKQFGEEVATQLLATHREKGIDVRTGVEVAALDRQDGRVNGVRLGDGSVVPADVVIAATGAQPRSHLVDGAERSGKGVKVGADLRAAGQVFAAGDIAQFTLENREPMRIEHWRIAEQQGRHAARVFLGQAGRFDAIPYFWSAQHGRLSYLGHADAFDEVHIEGDLKGNSFTAFYVKDGRILAALGLGKGDRTPALHAVMLEDPTPSRERLASVGWDPSRLLRAGLPV